jgi:hypothetical protein
VNDNDSPNLSSINLDLILNKNKLNELIQSKNNNIAESISDVFFYFILFLLIINILRQRYQAKN